MIARHASESLSTVPSPMCPLCDQPLSDLARLALVERNQRAHDEDVRAAITASVEAKLTASFETRRVAEQAKAATQAEAKVRKDYDKRFAQVERTNESLRGQLEISRRRLEQLSSDTRGSLSEEQLLLTLRQAFPTDQVERVRRGPAGRGDLLHEIIDAAGMGTKSAGRIVYECKDVGRWNNAFLAQAAAARERHRASHAVLVSTISPQPSSPFCVRDGVIVVPPIAAAAVASILRNSMCEIARRSLSADERDSQALKVLAFISSDDFSGTFAGVLDALTKAREALVKERRQHELTWGHREAFYQRIDRGMTSIHGALNDVLNDGVLDDDASPMRLVADSADEYDTRRAG